MGNNNTILFLYFLQVCGLALFLKGFFPMPDGITQEGTHVSKITRVNQTVTSQLVFFVIDALRTDFVNSTVNNHMPFLQSSIQSNNSCLMTIRTAAPTVTMPRIKAMTSGAIPSYVDVLLNLGSPEFTQDTFLRQAALHGLRTSFYGDDTWIKMFPELFTRSGGTHSFFAADFWEVDKNVTRQLEKELQRDDWDILVVHYLGLDHIGHMEGPFSQHVPQKLNEMDGVVKKVYEALKKDALFIVTGDHGMKDSGGHGGVTDAEIHVPLVSVGKTCRNLPGWPGVSEYTPFQIDLASTISTRLNLPIPSSNMGKLIPALLPSLPPPQIIQKLKEIKNQLIEHTGALDEGYKITDKMLKNILKDPNPDEVRLKLITRQLYHELSTLSDKLTKQRSDFNLSYIAAGCFLLLLTLFAVFALVRINFPSNAAQMTLTIGTLIHTLSLASTSFIEEEHQTWYFLWATLLVILLRERWRRKIVVKSYALDVKSCSLILLCVFHRLARKLNQTGDKWAHLPDWEDFIRPFPALLLILFASSLGWMFKVFADVNKIWWQRLPYIAGLASIAVYRVSVSSFDIPLFEFYPKSRGGYEVTAFWAILLVLIYQTTLPRGPSLSWSWSLLIALTLRPHNLILVPAQIYVSRQLYGIFSRDESPFWNTLAHTWMGYLFYFYQGNSNSIANVDVAPAFIGSDTYSPIYATILTLAHSYAAPIHAIILSPMAYQPILLARLLPMVFFCCLVVFQRHHLFVWSVFSPKLLMDSALTVVLFSVLCLHALSKCCNKG